MDNKIPINRLLIGEQITKEGRIKKKLFKIDDQIVLSGNSITVGTEIIANTSDENYEKYVPQVSIGRDELFVQAGWHLCRKY